MRPFFSIRVSLLAAALLMLQITPLLALSCAPNPLLAIYRLLAPEAGEEAVRRAAAEVTEHWLAPREIAIEARLAAVTCENNRATAKFEDVIWLKGRTPRSGPTALAEVPLYSCSSSLEGTAAHRLYFASVASTGEASAIELVLPGCSAFDATLPADIEKEIADLEEQAKRRKRPARIAHLQILKEEIAKQLAELRLQAASYSPYPPHDQAIPRGGILEKLLRPNP